MLLKEKASGQKAETLCKEMLQALLNNRNSDGSIGVGDADVLTHHLLLVLNCWMNPSLELSRDMALDWFDRLEDYREKKETDFNPFKLYALAHAGGKEHRNYIEEKTKALRTYHRKSIGYVVLQTGFTASGDIHDVFPTLMAADILLKEGSEESLSAAAETISWAMKEIDGQAVYQNVNSVLGFASLVSCKMSHATGNEEPLVAARRFIARLALNQKDGLWDGSKYQSAYVFYDLAQIQRFLPHEEISYLLDGFLTRVLEPSFFEDEELSGQNAVLVYATLLRGFALILTSRQRNRIIAKVLSSSLEAAREYHHKHVFIQHHQAKIQAILNDLNDKKFIAINPPIFNTRSFTFDNKQVFVIMPYASKTWYRIDPITDHLRSETYDFDRPFRNLIIPTLNKLGLKCIRADSIFAPQPFMEKIWTQINESALILADVTSGNPNVLYELGVAHTLGKPIIIVTQDPVYVPTDLKAIEFIKYDRDLGNEKLFKESLIKAIQDTLS